MPDRPTAVSTADLDAAAAFLRAGDGFFVTSHINSDGDGIAGGLAAQAMLRQLGKAADIVLQDVPDDGYAFLEGWQGILEAVDPPQSQYGRILVLDCPTLDRIGRAEAYLAADAAVLNVDHHHDNLRFGAANLVSDAVCSTCEMLYHLAVHMELDIDQAIAEHLYTGILFDTGGFRYSLTTPTSMEVGADLVRRGARLDRVADRLYNNANLTSVKLIGRAIDSLQLHCDEKVATLRLTSEDMRLGDPEAAVNYGLMVRGVEVAVLFKEEQAGAYRVSLRSREAVDVSAVAHVFGGGGHARAAGCRLQGDIDDVHSRLLAVVGELLP
jgi:phosphoesterase RecJ-like protein